MKGCTTMTHRPSEKCDDCFWWYEDQLLCVGCANNPETDEKRDTDTRRSSNGDTSI